MNDTGGYWGMLLRGQLNAADFGSPLESIDQLIERAEYMAVINWRYEQALRA